MLYNEELLKFPMNRFLDEAGVVLIWCTNAPSHILELSKVLLPAWNLEHIATWYWLKVCIVSKYHLKNLLGPRLSERN